MIKRKPLPRHYSGDKSRAFWRRVHGLLPADRDRGSAYFAGVLLQEMEERVLMMIENAERRAP